MVYTLHFSHYALDFVSKNWLSKPWITPAILKLIKPKSDVFQQYQRGLISVRQNNLIKNKITSAIRIYKRDSYRNSFRKFRNNMHKTWSTITSVLRTSHNKKTIKAILSNNFEITDVFHLAQLLTSFFTGVATQLVSNIPASNIDPLNLMSRVGASLFLFSVSVNGCTEVFDTLKFTRTSFNQLPVKLYKSLKNVNSPVITSIK